MSFDLKDTASHFTDKDREADCQGTKGARADREASRGEEHSRRASDGSDDGNIAIRVCGLGKHYHIYDTPRDRLKQFIAPRLQRVIGKPPKRYFREFWALNDVSFDVNKGETVGIVGRNGSGKSTLLQLICGTLSPTCGTVSTNGRIAALLELGSGFNPEFTGRENVHMNGAILGLSTKEIAARFNDIEAFADIGEFIDQPVKTYSSGMVVRLAFAVAINVEPQILIIDEALSVGDELFQRKCFSRIETIKKGGATILFVSHSGAAIVELCDRALLLDGGTLLASGEPKAIVGKYQKLLYAPEERRASIRDEIMLGNSPGGDIHGQDGSDAATSLSLNPAQGQCSEEFFDPHLKPQSTIVYESHGASIESPMILDSEGHQVNCLKTGGIYRYTYTVRTDAGLSNVRFGMLIKNMSGIELGGAVSAPGIKEALTYVAPNSLLRVEFRFQCRLNGGTYFLNAGVVGLRDGEETYLHRVLDACMFRVLPSACGIATGIVDFSCTANVDFPPGGE